MIAQLPALQVVVPLVCAAVCVLLRSPLAAWLLFSFAAVASLVTAAILTVQVWDGDVVRYAMGGWPAPVGIELVVDQANAVVLLLLGGIAVIAASYGRHSIEAEVRPRRIRMFYAALCLLLTGLLGIAATGDAFNLFVFLEISSLSSYALIALGRQRRALLAAFQYLVIGTVGGTFLLVGVGLAYAVTGTLNMADLASRLPDIASNRAVTGAVVFIFVGLAIKMALFPLHAWLPGAYSEAPSVVSVILAAVGTKVAIYAFTRFAFTVFGIDVVFTGLPIGQAILIVGSLAMFAGAAVACFQQDFKRLLAWSSISQIGMIVAGIGLATASGVGAAYLHLINHAIIKGALFAVAGVLLLRLGATSLESMSGLGRRMPLAFGAVVVAGLGLIGVPPTAGFASKWALAAALVEDGQWLVLAVMLASSLLAMVYVGRIVEVGWFRSPAQVTEPAPTPTPSQAPGNPGTGRLYGRTPALMAAPVALLVVASVYFGVDASWTAALADGAASVLTGGGSP
ncbi:MAG TPA: proton-conducting transporter membrane subunit [Jiangellaceae bacterium]|nr:proton-conducting transporter membrane subunit [Jiangellaceae bacterium]